LPGCLATFKWHGPRCSAPFAARVASLADDLAQQGEIQRFIGLASTVFAGPMTTAGSKPVLVSRQAW
jgi:hypothetical protein